MRKTTAPLVALGLLGATSFAQAPPGESPALGTNRITMADITGGLVTMDQVRRKGMEIFSTPFNKLDGFGDGPLDPFNADKTSPGNRPTLADNGTFMRMNGLDTQGCIECHNVGSTSVVPQRFGIGGFGGIAATAMPGPKEVDPDDDLNNGFAAYDGRLINPPFVFGAGGVEMLAKEMTADLQALMAQAQATPDVPVSLDTKGVNFGSITFDSGLGDFDTSAVEGVEHDLVVRPFGRKGEFATIREFDLGAFPFHQGMEPEELVDDMDGDGAPDPGVDNDPDGDGVFNELMPGEISAVHLFSVTLQRPTQKRKLDSVEGAGFATFNSIGCADCHVPQLETDSKFLPLQFPEQPTDPFNPAFNYATVDLSGSPLFFQAAPGGGVRVKLFSDLKRHDMGPGLAEHTPNGPEFNQSFVTPRLWGVADTPPYLHDGRAFTLTEAIEAHGGEAAAQQAAFVALSDTEKIQLLSFLRTLRTPRTPAEDLLDVPPFQAGPSQQL